MTSVVAPLILDTAACQLLTAAKLFVCVLKFIA